MSCLLLFVYIYAKLNTVAMKNGHYYEMKYTKLFVIKVL